MKRIDRRSFLKVSAAGAGGVLIGLYVQPKASAQARGGPAGTTARSAHLYQDRGGTAPSPSWPRTPKSARASRPCFRC